MYNEVVSSGETHFDSGDLKPSGQTEALLSQLKEKNSSGSGMGSNFLSMVTMRGQCWQNSEDKYFCFAEVNLLRQDLCF